MNSSPPCFFVSKSPCLFFLSGLTAALAIGWIAANVHLSARAPVGLVSLLVGLALGAAIAGSAHWARVVSMRQLLVGTLLFAFVTILTEHALLYSDFRRQWQEAREKDPHAAMFRGDEPWPPDEYFRREAMPGRIALWTVDAALIAGAALGVVIPWRPRLALESSLPTTPTPPSPDS